MSIVNNLIISVSLITWSVSLDPKDSIIMRLTYSKIRQLGYRTFLPRNSAEHDIYLAYKINVIMPTNVVILTLIRRIKECFCLSLPEILIIFHILSIYEQFKYCVQLS